MNTLARRYSYLMFIEDSIDSRCRYFVDLSPAQRKKQQDSILLTCDSLWRQFSCEEQDIEMLNKLIHPSGAAQISSNSDQCRRMESW